ncbi:unnamed protein product [Prorocentrum cordatum]|uniref:Uncharacterized protein n=1 Tax=Prorocentrum cordatum TaxID=2364126 RepID=A0ABN9PBL6_9DINO|nr:unnamed protein product [Polarella glacialis]
MLEEQTEGNNGDEQAATVQDTRPVSEATVTSEVFSSAAYDETTARPDRDALEALPERERKHGRCWSDSSPRAASRSVEEPPRTVARRPETQGHGEQQSNQEPWTSQEWDTDRSTGDACKVEEWKKSVWSKTDDEKN